MPESEGDCLRRSRLRQLRPLLHRRLRAPPPQDCQRVRAIACEREKQGAGRDHGGRVDDPKPETPNPNPQTRDPKPSTDPGYHRRGRLGVWCNRRNPHHAEPRHRPRGVNPKPQTISPKPQTLNKTINWSAFTQSSKQELKQTYIQSKTSFCVITLSLIANRNAAGTRSSSRCLPPWKTLRGCISFN